MKRLLLLAVLVVAATAIPAQASAAGPCRNDDLQRLVPRRQDRLDLPDLVLPRRDQARARRRADLLEPDRRHPRRDAGCDRAGCTARATSRTRSARACRRPRPSSSPGSGPNIEQRRERRGPTRPVGVSTIASPPVADSGSGSGVPVPLLVLGGLALLLAAAGGIGMLARRRGDRPSRLAAERHESPEARALGRQVEAERQQQQRVDEAERDREHERAGARSRRRSARSRRRSASATRRHWYGTG